MSAWWFALARSSGNRASTPFPICLCGSTHTSAHRSTYPVSVRQRTERMLVDAIPVHRVAKTHASSTRSLLRELVNRQTPRAGIRRSAVV